MVVVGTHLDCMQDQNRVKDLENKVRKKYRGPQYPKVRDDNVVSVVSQVYYRTCVRCSMQASVMKMQFCYNNLHDILCSYYCHITSY